jgi:PAS domain S-box-containing protein
MEIVNELLKEPKGASQPHPSRDSDLKTEYSEALFRKLQKKVADLEQATQVLNKATEAIVIATTDHRITFWNRGAEHLFGWSADDALGKTTDEMMFPRNPEAAAAIREALATKGDWRGEIQTSDRQGRPFVMESSATLIRDDKVLVTGLISISTDVTERKKLQEQLLRSQRLESIGLLAAGIAHDLNNVLAPVLMGAPMLREHVANPFDRSLLDMIEASASRGTGLVRQILGFAHGIGGEPQLLQVKHLLRDICSIISQTFPKSITLDEDLPESLWLIKAIPTQIHQVLLNLCVNARDAMPQGGTLRIRAENCMLDDSTANRLKGARPGAWLMLKVEDTGTGIPQELLDHIWEPFFTTKPADKGTGLGLSTVRGIVETHHGFITVQTSPGKGTVFQVYFPAAGVSSEAGGGDTPATVARGNGELILLVDDEKTIRDTASAILTRQGYRVLTACDGLEAATLFIPHAPDIALVITDLDMPKFGGDAFVTTIRHLNPTIPVIVMTGVEENGSTAFIAKSPSVTFLQKPFTSESLQTAVQGLIQGNLA